MLIDVIAKMDSIHHTVLTNSIIPYQTTINIYKKILQKNAYTS